MYGGISSLMQRKQFNALLAAAPLASVSRGRRAAAAPAVAAKTNPAPTFEEASAAIRAIIAHDAADPLLTPTALPRFYEHGAPVDDAIVLLHGFTNSPQQFDELARIFFARGCNVYVPRIPLHGRKDRLTEALANLTVADLQGCTQESYQLARGLGKRVTVLGLSIGGTMALWLAQTHPVDVAIPVAPFLIPIGFPRWLGMLAMHVLAILPNMYWWWDPRVKEKSLPVYAYPGFPTHALAQIVFLGGEVFALANQTAPRARESILVTNANESAVNDGVAFELFAIWKQRGAKYRQVVLSGLGKPRHDIIDPTTFPQARTLVYPKLEALVLGNPTHQ